MMMKIAILIGTAALWFIFSPGQLALVGLFCIGILFGVFFCLIRLPGDFDNVFRIFCLALFIRCGLSLLFYLLSFLPFGYQEGFLFASDGFGYSENGWRVLQMAEHGVPFNMDRFIFYMGYRGTASGTFTTYDIWIKWVYFVVGKKPMVLFFFNSIAGALPVLFVYDLCFRLFNKKIASLAAWFSTLWPSLIFWSTQNLREPFVNLGFIVLIWGFAMVRTRPGLYLVLPAVGAFFILYGLRWQVIPLIVIPAFILAYLLTTHTWTKCTKFEKGFFILCTSALLALLFIPTLIWLEKKYASYHPSLWHWLHYFRQVRTLDARSAILVGADLRSFSKILAFLPLGLCYSLFAPFPWHLGSMQQILGALEMMVLYFFLPCFLSGLRYAVKNSWREIAFMVFFIPLMASVYGILEGNVGTLFRHRSILLYTYFILIAVGYFLRKERKRLTLRRIEL